MSPDLVQVAQGRRGAAAIAAGSIAAARAGALILAAGGNAVDAVVAATATATVAEPGLTSLGGGGFLIAREPDGEVRLLDFFVAAPGIGRPTQDHHEPRELVVRFAGAEQVFRIGPASVAIPGVVDGLIQCHRRLGRNPLAEVLTPAVRAARDGVVPDSAQSSILRLLVDVLSSTAQARELYTDGGQPWAADRGLTNPALATVFEGMGSGVIDGIANGGLVAALLEAAGATGVVTEQDALHYRVLERSPLRVLLADSGDGSTLLTNPPPSFGGRIVADALQLWAEDNRGLVALPGYVGASAARVKKTLEGGGSVRTGTTHVSAVDAAGGIASMTTSNGSCSGVMLEGYGIQLNNMMGEQDLHPAGFHTQEPGTRLRSMMSPTVFERSDGGVFALGSGGSERIRSALAAVIARLVMGEDLPSAIAAPRAHLDDRHYLHVEPNLPEPEATAMATSIAEWSAVPTINRWGTTDLFFGGVNAVHRRADGSVEAVADRRRGGVALLVDTQ